MDKKEKMWGQLTTCWSNLSPQLDHLKDHLKTRLAPITQQCSTWLQGGSFNNETVRIGCRDFQVLKKLGEGGYSFVYLVQELVPNADGALGCSYALKKVLADRHTLDEATKEMDLMKKLHHPSLLPLLDSSVVQVQGTSSGASHVVYMLFPLYEGGNLWDLVQDRLQQGTPLSPAEITHVALQLCAGLQHMHDQGLSHWDLKPHNVLLSWQDQPGLAPHQKRVQQSRAVLIDFGSARTCTIHVSNRAQAVAVQEDAERHSTAPYRPPELWDVPSSCTIDSKVDVWALGCVLYYMMVGESPFEKAANESGGSLLLAVANGNVPWPQDVVHRYPESLRQVVVRCLSGDPAQRPDVGTVASQLQALQS